MPDPIIYTDDGFPDTMLVSAPTNKPRTCTRARAQQSSDTSHRRRATSFRLEAIGFTIIGSVIAALLIMGVI